MARADVQEIIDNFDFLDDWEDRYKYVIELGDQLSALTDAEKTAENKVNGCASQVWLVTSISRENGEAMMRLRGDSDAHIVRGLLSIVVTLFDQMSVAEAATYDPETVFSEIGLREHLSAQRSNGLTAVVQRIRQEAQAAQKVA